MVPEITIQCLDPQTAVSVRGLVESIAKPIVETDSPTSEAQLLKLYCQSVGIKRLSAQKRDILVPNLRAVLRFEMDGPFVTYWSDSSEPSSYDIYRVANDPKSSRDISCIPLPEIINACIDTVEQCGAIDRESVAYAVGKTLGFNRAGTNIRETTEQAMAIAIRKGLLKDSDGTVTLP